VNDLRSERALIHKSSVFFHVGGWDKANGTAITSPELVDHIIAQSQALVRAIEALFCLRSPGRQVERLQPFSAQEGADLAGLFTVVGLIQDTQLVLGLELAAPGLGTTSGSGMPVGGF
jgi:hypothetical protein